MEVGTESLPSSPTVEDCIDAIQHQLWMVEIAGASPSSCSVIFFMAAVYPRIRLPSCLVTIGGRP